MPGWDALDGDSESASYKCYPKGHTGLPVLFLCLGNRFGTVMNFHNTSVILPMSSARRYQAEGSFFLQVIVTTESHLLATCERHV